MMDFAWIQQGWTQQVILKGLIVSWRVVSFRLKMLFLQHICVLLGLLVAKLLHYSDWSLQSCCALETRGNQQSVSSKRFIQINHKSSADPASKVKGGDISDIWKSSLISVSLL